MRPWTQKSALIQPKTSLGKGLKNVYSKGLRWLYPLFGGGSLVTIQSTAFYNCISLNQVNFTGCRSLMRTPLRGAVRKERDCPAEELTTENASICLSVVVDFDFCLLSPQACISVELQRWPPCSASSRSGARQG